MIDFYIDQTGVIRNLSVELGDSNIGMINHALDEITNITGVEFNQVDTEDKSELNFPKIDHVTGLETWGVLEGAVGIATAHRDGGNKVYFESNLDEDYTRHIVFHEVARVFGLPELAEPFMVSSLESIRGYDFQGFVGFTDIDRQMLIDYWQ